MPRSRKQTDEQEPIEAVEAAPIDMENTPRRRPAANDDLPDTALFWRWVRDATWPLAGWIVAGIGLIFIIAGYLGISREALVAKQMPYLVSGGIGGIALVGAGAALIRMDELRTQRKRIDELEAMVRDLHGVLLAHPDAPVAETAVSGNGHTSSWRIEGHDANPDGSTLVALPDGQSYHRADCAMVQGKPAAAAITPSAARHRGLSPCRMCDPDPVKA